MIDDKTKLDKILKEQTKQIESLKKAVAGLQQQINIMGKKVNRSYETGKKNANDINSIINTLRKNV